MHSFPLLLALGLTVTAAQAQSPEDIKTVQEALADYGVGSADGDRFEGAWHEGKPHGQGVLVDANGIIFSGKGGCLRAEGAIWAFMRSEEYCGF